MTSTWSQTALAYFLGHAISANVATRCDVVERAGELVFPIRRSDGTYFERRRSLDGGPKVRQPAGEPLSLWWPLSPPALARTVFLVEGESDALSALSAWILAWPPELEAYAIGALPGTGFPVERVVEELTRIETISALLAFDGDDAGRRLTRKMRAALDLAGIRSLPLAIPDGLDLSDVLASEPPATRGTRFSELLKGASTETLAVAA